MADVLKSIFQSTKQLEQNARNNTPSTVHAISNVTLIKLYDAIRRDY